MKQTNNYLSPDCEVLTLQPDRCIAASYTENQAEGLTDGWGENWDEN